MIKNVILTHLLFVALSYTYDQKAFNVIKIPEKKQNIFYVIVEKTLKIPV